jgi:MYXO-CTERM domain-containing protein
MKTKLTNVVKWGLGAVALSLSTLGHANLITNGNFDSDTVWVTNNIQISTGAARGPSGNETSASIKQSVASLSASTTYLLDFSVFMPTGVTLDVTFGTLDFDDLDFAISNTGDLYTYSGVVDSLFGLFGTQELVFSFTSPSLANYYLDNVSLTCDPGIPGNCATTSVPEPGSLLLAGAALAGLGLVRRRRSA